MLNKTRQLFDAYTTKIALLNSVAVVTASFTVEPSVAQTLETNIQQSDNFLQLVNVIEVDAQKGEKVGIGVTGSIAGRTNTDNEARKAKNVSALSSDGYMCEETHFDTALPYKLLDSWRHHSDFQIKLRDAIIRQQGLDRLKIGFHGREVARDTNPEVNKMLEDVNIGWLQQIRDKAPEQHMDGVHIGLGEGAAYKNLDAAVLDAKDLLHETLQGHPDLVVITSYSFINDKYVKLASDNDEPTEKEALQRLLTNKRAGGLPVIAAPFFPNNAFLITTLQNLSIYWQSGTRRRHIQEKPERSRVEDYQSVNEAYVVEEYEACAFFENITFDGDEPVESGA